MPRRSTFGACVSLLLFCSCATQQDRTAAHSPVRAGPAAGSRNSPGDSVSSQLPAELTMNEGAGRGDLLFVTLRLESGEELPFILDTGAPGTLFDKSLVSKLGIRLPLGTWPVWTLGEKQESGLYVEPRLYLGNACLMTGGLVAVFDTSKLSSMSGRPVMGILGMDCLKHYCIQLDFEARKLRFLDPRQANAAKPGKAVPLTFSFPGGQPSIRHLGLAGGKNSRSEIDTGFNLDGQVERGSIHGQGAGVAHLSTCIWEGETYSDLAVGVGEDANRLGLRFLARHLVTLDFPNRTMYLKRTSNGPLLSSEVQAAGNAASRSAVSFLKSLLMVGRLPGWSSQDEVATNEVGFQFDYPNAITCDHLLKKGDSSVYHYELVRASTDGPWRLRRAWRTDQSGRTFEEYPISQAGRVTSGP